MIAQQLQWYASKMIYFLVTATWLLTACGGGEPPTAQTRAIKDTQSILAFQALPKAANKQQYRLVICTSSNNECRDALQTKDGRAVTFVYDTRSQYLVSDSDKGVVIALKYLSQAQKEIDRKGKSRQSLIIWPAIIAGITIGVLLLRLKKAPQELILINTTPGQEELVHALPKAQDSWRKFIAGAVGAATAITAVHWLDQHVWGYGERQAAIHWNSIFSEADHKNATEVKDIDSIVQALAEAFGLMVKDQ